VGAAAGPPNMNGCEPAAPVLVLPPKVLILPLDELLFTPNVVAAGAAPPPKLKAGAAPDCAPKAIPPDPEPNNPPALELEGKLLAAGGIVVADKLDASPD
jgi:hypothetical protein